MKATDEEIIAALLENNTVSGAADSLKMSRVALYSRMKNTDFRQTFERTVGGILSQASAELTLALSDSISTLREIAQDSGANPQTRMLAADRLIGHCARFFELSHASRRRDEAEDGEIKLDFSNMFG